MTVIKSTPVANRLLEALPNTERQQFVAACTQVELTSGEVLAEPGEQMTYVYFPNSCFISLVMPIDSHSNLEVGLIGDEGMLGVSLILGIEVSPLRALVQGAGSALRIDTATFTFKLEQTPALQRKLKHYHYVVMCQLAQTAACTHYHVVEARLARWLLMTHDRAHSDTFHITHEFLAYMLGVRRVGVTRAASSLQNKNLIHYQRGEITIIDRIGLEAASCGCYAADLASYTQMMG
jgi:CRP-like cAMP-binding protein